MSTPTHAPSCLDDETLAAFVEGKLGSEEADAVENHVGTCTSCYHVLVEYARSYGVELRVKDAHDGGRGASRSTSAQGREDVANARELRSRAPGARVGRYVILDWLGEGGGGVVYAAYDPELDRRIALKLVSPAGPARGATREALLGEARALAKVAHPNVVSVHDVGVLEDHVFLAMECIDGPNLRTWVREAKPTGAEMLRVLVEAGRGLSAAHAAGLVHRDFKPENVLLGEDGRARVVDFGLAEALETPEEEDAPDGSRPVAGTPAYMAPEQRRGERADARTDEYAFCITAEECLAVAAPPPPGAPRIAEALARGRSEQARDRFASMRDLLDELTRPPPTGARHRMAWAGAAALLVAAALVVRAKHVTGPEAMCRARAERVAGVWGAGTAKRVRDALDRAKVPDAEAVVTRLDAYASSWSTTTRETCEATHVRGEQSVELEAARVACLDRRLDDLRAFAEVLGDANATTAPRIDDALRSLPSLSLCTRARDARTKPAGEAGEQVDLADARALAAVGRYEDARLRAEPVVATARARGDRATLAEALYLLGWATSEAGDRERGVAMLYESAWHADATARDRTRARVWMALLFQVVAREGRREMTDLLEDEARAALARLGGDPEERARFEAVVASLRQPAASPPPL